jgi:integrase/recombinase XerD
METGGRFGGGWVGIERVSYRISLHLLGCGGRAMTMIRWARFPFSEREPQVQMWLTMEADLGRAQNTVEAYARGLEDFLGFLSRRDLPVVTVSRANVAAYVRDLDTRGSRHGAEGDTAGYGQLANATL